MEKSDKKKDKLKGNPIKLNDLIPRDNVSGGKSKKIFGAIDRVERKKRGIL